MLLMLTQVKTNTITKQMETPMALVDQYRKEAKQYKDKLDKIHTQRQAETQQMRDLQRSNNLLIGQVREKGEKVKELRFKLRLEQDQVSMNLDQMQPDDPVIFPKVINGANGRNGSPNKSPNKIPKNTAPRERVEARVVRESPQPRKQSPTKTKKEAKATPKNEAQKRETPKKETPKKETAKKAKKETSQKKPKKEKKIDTQKLDEKLDATQKLDKDYVAVAQTEQGSASSERSEKPEKTKTFSRPASGAETFTPAQPSQPTHQKTPSVSKHDIQQSDDYEQDPDQEPEEPGEDALDEALDEPVKLIPTSPHVVDKEYVQPMDDFSDEPFIRSKSNKSIQTRIGIATPKTKKSQKAQEDDDEEDEYASDFS